MPIEKLSAQQVEQELRVHKDWRLQDGKLYRCFKFASFVEAFGFMTRAALLAEKMDHHPEWSNVYSRVDVYLTTHDAGGISERDFLLASALDGLL
jgi:4a-hydroxytetrahydrobiopterin dehydratase